MNELKATLKEFFELFRRTLWLKQIQKQSAKSIKYKIKSERFKEKADSSIKEYKKVYYYDNE